MGSANNNNNANGFEFYTNGCSHASATPSTMNKQQQQQSTTIGERYSNGITDDTILNNQHKDLIQSRGKCKQAPTRTNNVYHHSNGIGTTTISTTTTHLTAAPSNHQLAHVINSLSSPESAYSTGYSTDGTSPSGTYTHKYTFNTMLSFKLQCNTQKIQFKYLKEM